MLVATIIASAMGFASGEVHAHQLGGVAVFTGIPAFLLLLFLYLSANAKKTWIGVISFLAALLFAFIWLFVLLGLISGKGLH